MNGFMCFLAICAALVALLAGLRTDNLNNRLSRLEQKVEAQAVARSQSCARGIAVMTPEGHATTVCAP